MLIAREPIPYSELLDRLADSTGSEHVKVEKLLADLWEQTLLLTDLAPGFLSSDPARQIVDRLGSIGEAGAECAALSSLLEELCDWDGAGLDVAISRYGSLADRVEAMVGKNGGASIQVDLKLELEGCAINEAVAVEVARAAELLLRLTPHPSGPPALSSYRQAFVAKYNEGREVSLLELLDPTVGLGPLGPVSFPTNSSGTQELRRGQILFDLACHALRSGETVVELDEHLLADLQTCPPDSATFPLSMDIYALVGARSAAALDAGDFTVVVGPNVGVVGAGKNFGRFAYLFDHEENELLRSTTRAEEALSPGIVTAELVYRPRRFRLANVIVRPSVREYALCLCGDSGAAEVKTIPLDELVVGVRHNRFYLRWPAADREVWISSCHMLNTYNAPEIGRFVTEMAQDGVAQLSGFSWGPAEGFPFLPRVQSGRVVLRPAEWRIGPTQRRRNIGLDSPAEFRRTFSRWRQLWNVPRRVFLAQGDNRLALDLEDQADIEELFHEIRTINNQGTLLLQEVLPSFDDVWVQGPGGRYYSEIVVPLVLASRNSAELDASRPVTEGALKVGSKPRSKTESSLKPPGTDWLYLKIYCGLKTQDDLIAGPLRDFGAFVLSEELAERWFFLRYSDPDPHLRVRFQGNPSVLTTQLFPSVCDWASQLLANGSCHHFAFDTYDREVERYGGVEAIDIAESIFFADSIAVVNYKALTARKAISLDTETLAVITVDNLLAGLGLSESDRISWLRGFVTWRADVGTVFRKRQSLLRAQLCEARRRDTDGTGNPLQSALTAARNSLAPEGAHLGDMVLRSQLNQELGNLYTHFVHMHCNRLIGSASLVERTALGLLLRASESLQEHPCTTP